MGMMDLSKSVGIKYRLVSQLAFIKGLLPEEDVSENKKSCADCKATKTPLWRAGPSGPKSLCNACGIRYRKRKVSTMGLSTQRMREKTNGHYTTTTTTTTTSTRPLSEATAPTTTTPESIGSDVRDSVEIRVVALGKQVWRSPSSVRKQRCQRPRRILGEEEQAAVSLMALSYGIGFV